LKPRLCCRETSHRNVVDVRCDRNRKSIKQPGKDSQGCDFCTISQLCSPDGAERNPGLPRGIDAAPDFAALHPGYTRFVQSGLRSLRSIRATLAI
jgi:hypothetical protein